MWPKMSLMKGPGRRNPVVYCAAETMKSDSFACDKETLMNLVIIQHAVSLSVIFLF